MYFSEGLRCLAAHDAESDVSYLDTLRVYLNNNMSISKTAAALYIHRSTLLERITRIKRDLRIDLQNPDERLRIQILLKAMQVVL
jgi:DNA-binding PucR family transcriptional regulator